MIGGKLTEIVQLKKAWKSRTIKLLLLIFAGVLLFNALEFQNLVIPGFPIAFTGNGISSASPGIISGKESSLLINDSSNAIEFPSVGSIGDDKNITDVSILVVEEEKKKKENQVVEVLSASGKSPVVEDRGTKKRERKKKKVLKVVSMSDMEDLLSKNRASPSSMIPLWPSEVDEQMLHAKAEIQNAPIVTNDEQLYGPVFRNLSTFKRSYELMEKMLKVYVYKEGDKPVFHEPFFVGIYASEGWFMKQMEESKNFLVDDPNKAHLFYIPFSSTNLRFSMYIPKIHNHKELVDYMKSYIELISSKYPFWNRTGGGDHFLAGCHDWATGETEQSMKPAIRALCTANAQKGFEIGKDISLPATKIFHKNNPQLNLGGTPAHKRTTLAFFAGQMHGYLRPILIQYWENKDPDMAISGPLPRLISENTSRKKKKKKSKKRNPYLYYMKNSKYCLCPRGYEVWSTRVMESIYYGCVPVLISDNFVPPLFEVLNWSAFSVIVPEKDVPRLKEVLMGIPRQRYLELGRGVREVRKHFLWNTSPVRYDLFHMILHSVWFNRLNQIRVE